MTNKMYNQILELTNCVEVIDFIEELENEIEKLKNRVSQLEAVCKDYEDTWKFNERWFEGF